MQEQDGAARASEILVRRLQALLDEIGAATRERSDASVRAARLKLAVNHGAKRVRLRLAQPPSSRAA